MPSPKTILAVILFYLILGASWTNLAFSGLLETYEGFGESPVNEQNFSLARKTAKKKALRNALDSALRDLLGDKTYEERSNAIQKVLRSPENFTRSYRFLDLNEDEIDLISQVHLEVTFFGEAITNELNNRGILSSVIPKNSLVVMIVEKNLTSQDPQDFWDYLPISEVALTQQFEKAGYQVMSRQDFSEPVPEKKVSRAATGDVQAAVDIGLKSGANIVLVGNAVSSELSAGLDSEKKTIRTSLNVKAISSLKSKIIAAKSDFHSISTTDLIEGELEAFQNVSKKMGTFLKNAIDRYLNVKPHKEPTPVDPGFEDISSLPGMDDL